jgi:cytoskeletal protein CcmA (bactofilin family)
VWKRDQSAAPPVAAPYQPVTEVKPVAVTSPPLPPERVGNDLGKSVVIKGELSGSEDLILHGQMEGSISLPAHTLTVGPQAEVKADITAKAVVVIGAVTGKVSAADRIEIRSSGSVTGDVTSPRLVIADGGSLRGKVEMTR